MNKCGGLFDVMKATGCQLPIIVMGNTALTNLITATPMGANLQHDQVSLNLQAR